MIRGTPIYKILSIFDISNIMRRTAIEITSNSNPMNSNNLRIISKLQIQCELQYLRLGNAEGRDKLFQPNKHNDFSRSKPYKKTVTDYPSVTVFPFQYPGPESNRYDRNGHRILSPARLPVPPPGRFKQKPECGRNIQAIWSEKRDSNPRPRPWQGRALPTELFSRLGWQI